MTLLNHGVHGGTEVCWISGWRLRWNHGWTRTNADEFGWICEGGDRDLVGDFMLSTKRTERTEIEGGRVCAARWDAVECILDLDTFGVA